MLVPLEKPGTPEELVHFGTKGMKWGVRKEYETSNGKSAKSTVPNDRIFKEQRAARRERRALGHEAVARKEQQKIDLIKANPSEHWIVQHHRNNLIKEHEKERDLRLKDAADIRAGKFTTFQKKAIAGGIAAGVVLTAVGTARAVDAGQINRFKTRNIPFAKNDALSGHMTTSQIMNKVIKPINRDYFNPDDSVLGGTIKELGSKMNCRRCTFAYEMRRRGMDVKATKSVLGSGQSHLGLVEATSTKSGARDILRTLNPKSSTFRTMKITRGLGMEPISDKSWTKMLPIPNSDTRYYAVSPQQKGKQIWNALSEHPNGARGELGLKWRSGGAHSVAWEIINGKPHIFDTQSGTAYHTQASFVKSVAGQVSEAGMTRLDNIPMDEGFLRRWVTNV